MSNNLFRTYRRILWVPMVWLLMGLSCDFIGNNEDEYLVLDKKQMSTDFQNISTFSHPFGTNAQKKVKDYIVKRAKTYSSFDTIVSEFKAKTPNPKLVNNPKGMYALTIEKTGYNIFVLPKEAKCVVLFASHYDTKHSEFFEYYGANDSGSSTVGLLAMLDYWNSYKYEGDKDCKIGMVFFDGEEATLWNWYDGLDIHPARIEDNTYGSRYEAARLIPCSTSKGLCLPKTLGNMELRSLILLDMIGSKDIKLTLELNSSKGLKELAVKKDKKLFPKASIFGGYEESEVLDDHIPFVRRGIPSIDLIDFNNISFWHRKGDTIENVSLESIEKAVNLAVAMSLEVIKKDSKQWLKK